LAWWALEHLLGGDTSRVIVVGALLAGVAVVSVRAHESVDQFARTCLFVLGGELLATNYLQPWYALWLLPFLVVTAAAAWRWLTGTLPLIYVFGIEGRLPWWVRVAIYGPFLALTAWRIARPRCAAPVTVQPLSAASVAAVIPVLDEAGALPGVLAEF